MLLNNITYNHIGVVHVLLDIDIYNQQGSVWENNFAFVDMFDNCNNYNLLTHVHLPARQMLLHTDQHRFTSEEIVTGVFVKCCLDIVV